jgi:ABC-type transport system involved in multi-copper enzyme maturation permease subunit
MRPLFRDIIRVVRHPAVAVVLVLLALSGTSAFQLTGSTVVELTSPVATYAAISYNYSNEYQFNVLAYTETGSSLAVVAGASIDLGFYLSNGTGQLLGDVNGVTGSHGFLSLNWNSAPCQCDVEVNVTTPNSELIGSNRLMFPAPENLTPLFGVFSTVPSGLFLSKPLFVVAYFDSSDKVPPGTTLTYCVQSFPPSGEESCLTHDLGSITSNLQAFPIVQTLSLSDLQLVQFNLTGPGGANLYTEQFQYGSLDPRYVTETLTAAGLTAAIQTMSFLVAFAGALIGYVGYARDRLNGTLDPVLALPITRSRLLITRYASAVLVSILGSIIGAAILLFTVSQIQGDTLPASLWLGLPAAFAMEGVAFVGLAYLGAHLTKSSTLLLVVLILLTAALTLLWVPFISVLAHLTGLPVDMTTPATQSAVAGWSPAQSSISIVGLILLNYNGEGPYLLPAITNAGVLTTLVLAWVAIPIALAWLLFRFRD